MVAAMAAPGMSQRQPRRWGPPKSLSVGRPPPLGRCGRGRTGREFPYAVPWECAARGVAARGGADPLGGTCGSGEADAGTGGASLGELARALTERPLVMRRRTIPPAACLDMPRGPGPGARRRLEGKNGCGCERIIGIPQSLRNAATCCPLCMLTATLRNRQKRKRKTMKEMAVHRYAVSP